VSDLRALEGAADLTFAITREAYPSLEIPFHSRWRHSWWTVTIGGGPRWNAQWSTPAREHARNSTSPSISVLLDAGAGPDWHYRDGGTGRNRPFRGAGACEPRNVPRMAVFRRFR